MGDLDLAFLRAFSAERDTVILDRQLPELKRVVGKLLDAYCSLEQLLSVRSLGGEAQVIPLSHLYSAKPFTADTLAGRFEASGTLCGHIDFVGPFSGTFVLSPDEALALIAMLQSVRADVLDNSDPFGDPRLVNRSPAVPLGCSGDVEGLRTSGAALGDKSALSAAPPSPAGGGSVSSETRLDAPSAPSVDAALPDPWRPITEAVGKPGTYINVRSVTTYRWHTYKPDGARQMKKAGRWQVADEYGGWSNAALPENAEWAPLRTPVSAEEIPGETISPPNSNPLEVGEGS